MQETVYQVSAPLRGESWLALLTDLHDRSPRLLLPSLRSHRPDLILIAGDFLHGEIPEGNGLKMEESPSLHLFRELARIAPTYVSLGNHEWMLCPEDFDCIAGTGVHVLDNAFVTLDGLVLGGLTSGTVLRSRREHDPKGDRYAFTHPYLKTSLFRQFLPEKREIHEDYLPDISWLRDYEQTPGFHVLLSHHPEYGQYPPVCLMDRPVELILSGHAHGGQIRYYSLLRRRWAGVFAPFQGIFPEFSEGMHEGRYGKLIISRGLANTGPVPRLFNPRELVYIHLTGTDTSG